MNDRSKKYTDKENRRRYRLHYKARKQDAEICTAEKTCKVVLGADIGSFSKKLIEEFNYAVQFVIAPPKKKLIAKH